MASELRSEVLKAVHRANDLYQLVPAGEQVMIAFSGGKDSLLLGLILTDLGIPVICVSIDMGYEAGWGDRIKGLAERASLPVDVVDVRRRAAVDSRRDRQQLEQSLIALDLLSNRPVGPATPCTHCYHVKVLALQSAAIRHGVKTVAFGHHRTDAFASLLKEALMFIDRWDDDHPVFVRDNFAALVERLYDETQSTVAGPGQPLIRRITELVRADKVDTDEPPRQPLNRDDPDITLVRPMFFVDEKMIVRLIEELGIPTEGSGCGHGIAANYLTPREMVHYRVLRRTTGAWFHNHMLDLLLHGINADGTARLEARRHRATLLGDGYKPTAIGLDKP